MKQNNKLPENLWALRDLLVECVHANEPLPAEVDLLYKWLSNDGWDELVGEGADEKMIFEISRFGGDEYDLREMLELDDSDEITDQMKIDYTREKIADAVSGEDNYDNPTVAFYTLERNDGKSAVLCAILTCQQGGWDADWGGILLTEDDHLQKLKACGLWNYEDVELVDDASILDIW